MLKKSNILITETSPDYQLVDSGDGEKLEKFGSVILARPDPQATWPKRLSIDEWKKAEGHFIREEKGGSWSLKKNVPEKWQINLEDLKFWIKPTAFKHTGIFPEQTVNWSWMKEKIVTRIKENSNSKPEILNLFGYTGGATLSCAQAGASLVHIDSSKSAISWARENVELSGLNDKPIRWIIEDARIFVEREIKRGRKYDAIIMDPPAFGHGVNNELWKIEEHLLPLIENCKKLLSEQPLFFLINGYSAGYSAIAYENNLLTLVEKYDGEIEIGELAIREVIIDSQKLQRILPAGIFSRWSNK